MDFWREATAIFVAATNLARALMHGNPQNEYALCSRVKCISIFMISRPMRALSSSLLVPQGAMPKIVDALDILDDKAKVIQIGLDATAVLIETAAAKTLELSQETGAPIDAHETLLGPSRQFFRRTERKHSIQPGR